MDEVEMKCLDLFNLKCSKNPFVRNVPVNDHYIDMGLDTGAGCSFISENFYQKNISQIPMVES